MDDNTTDNTTGNLLKASRHVSVWIEAAPDGWVADSPMGAVTVEFAPPNEFGVLDHVVRLPSGEAVYNPVRVIPGGVGQPRREVLFTVRRRAGMTDAEFDADAAAVAADLDTLRRLLEV
jgi:hypothetical protein